MAIAKNKHPKIKKDSNYIYHYKYDIEFTCSSDKKMSIKPISIVSISKECDYFSKFSPFIVVACKLYIYDIIKLKQVEKELMANVIFKSIIYKQTDNGLVKVDNKIESSGLFTPIFAAGALDGIQDDLYTEMHPVEKGKKMTNDNQDDDPEYKEINIMLIDYIASNVAKAPYNYCLEKGWKVGDLVLNVASETKAKGFIIDSMDNQEEQDQAIIPPNNFIQTLNTIQAVFGMYNNGLLLFYDDDVLYILNKFSPKHDHKKEEKSVTQLYINDYHRNPIGKSDVERSLTEQDEPLYSGLVECSSSNMDLIIGETKADTLIFSNFTLAHNTLLSNESGKMTQVKKPALAMKRASESHKHSGNRIMFDYDELNNPYNVASYFSESEAESNDVIFSVDNANINDFRCNKFILPTFENMSLHNRLNGMYHIKSVTFQFTPIKNTNELLCSCIVKTCKRVKKQ